MQAAFALDGLHHHGDDVGVAFGGLLQCVEVVDRHAQKAFEQRAEAVADLGVGGGRHGGDGAAMEGVLIDHDHRLFDALVHAVLARDLDGGLVGFQARVAEEHVVHLGALDQQLGELLLPGHMVVIGGMDQLGHLFLQRGHELGVVVAQCVHRNAGQTV
ncbi:hypothetical protein SDC9_195481 [bioreactor metagenome]|uniref:Uncharacterized protein n=1 Tax=bioreactor metagenome TaxID=1076179 RepID=A0A645I961_9ZZZZ